MISTASLHLLIDNCFIQSFKFAAISRTTVYLLLMSVLVQHTLPAMASAGKRKSKARETDIINPVMPLPPAEPESDWGSDPSLIVHHGVTCDGPLCTDVHEPIRGVRYKCSVCPKRDFCDSCVRQKDNFHDQTHMLFECLGPAEFIEATAPNREDLELLDDISGPVSPEILDLRNLSILNEPGEAQRSLEEPQVNFVPKQGIPAILQGVKHHQDMLVQGMMGRIKKYDYFDSQLQNYPGNETAIARLIDLQPGQGDEKIRCTFRLTRLKDAEEFEVACCTWRDLRRKQKQMECESHAPHVVLPAFEESSHAVYIGEHHFLEASLGLSEALRQLRYPDKVRTIWTEELCIDRDNDFERHFQMRARGLIYNRASDVFVWAGNDDENTVPAFGLMMLLAHRCDSEGHLPLEPWGIDLDPDLPSIDSEEWRSLLRLFPQEVLDCRWDLEDVSFAANATFACGEYRLEWMGVANIARMLSQDVWRSHLNVGTMVTGIVA